MDWITPFVLSGAIVAGDYASTQGALARGGTEYGPIKNQQVRASVQFVAIAGIDVLIQKRAPKLKWYWRGAVIAGSVAIMAHNDRVAR